MLHLQLHGNSASDDIEDPVKIRTLLKDLREVRQAKSRDGLQALDYSELSVGRI
jgi:GINS complex subunit 2